VPKKFTPAKAFQNIDMEAVSRIARNATLEEIYLVESKIKSHPINRDPKGIIIEQKCGTELFNIDSDNNIIHILCNFLVVAYSKENRKNVLMSIEASFASSYQIDTLEKFNKNEINMFVRINPLYNTWPYWRELVQNFTMRMGFPALVVPLLIIEPKKIVDRKKKLQS